MSVTWFTMHQPRPQGGGGKVREKRSGDEVDHARHYATFSVWRLSMSRIRINALGCISLPSDAESRL